MKILSCYIPATSGTANIYGYDVHNHALEIKKILGYLPEHNPLYGNMYVKEYLSFVADIHEIKNKKKRIDELIEMTGLEKECKKTISSLSKGYKQRVGIAQSIIHQPKVLILDEPISGLDPNQIIEIRRLISSLKDSMTVIFSSHILHEVESLCDRIVILDQGKIVADDEIGKISSSKESSYQIQLEFLNSFEHNIFKTLNEKMEIIKQGDKKYTLTVFSSKDIRESLFDIAVKNGNKILEMHSQESSLENVFKSLTKNTAND
jgi:ABC-2 type transport system ATP-binding protein